MNATDMCEAEGASSVPPFVPAPGDCLIVMYHYVADLMKGTFKGQKGLSPAEFDRQIADLKKDFDLITWEQYRSQRATGRGADKPTVMFSLDDGLACQANVAAPILERHGARGVFFVPGSVLAGGRLLDAHKFHILAPLMGDGTAIYEAVERELTRTDPRTDWCRRVDPVRAEAEYAHEKDPRIRQLKFLLNFVLPSDIRRRVLDPLMTDHGVDERKQAKRWYGSLKLWKRLQDRGHTIGGHGFAHEPLAELSPEAQERDLRASHQALKDLLGPGARPMSYPFGSYNANTAVLASRAGFAAAVTTRRGSNDLSTDVYQLRRIDGREEDVDEILALMRGAQR